MVIKMAYIQIDYENAVLMAKRLDAAAEKCGEAAKNMKTQSGNAEQYWKGNSGNAMRAKMLESVKELAAIQSLLLTTAGDIRRVAEELKEADQNAAGFIRTGI